MRRCAIRPPAAADLRSALDNLIEQDLDWQFPAHPKFSKDELRLTAGLVQQAYEKVREALEAPESRVAIDRDVRKSFAHCSIRWSLRMSVSSSWR
jgi:hypothetical protein